MIEKIRKGRGARRLSEYLLASRDHKGALRPRADILGGTLAGRSPRELAAEIGMLRRTRPNLQTAVGHVSLRVPEGERALSGREWAAIGDRWAGEMGMDSYCTVCHGDHIHLVFSRINSDGSVVSDSHDYRRGEAAVRKIEREFGLVRVEPSHLLEPEKAQAHRKAPRQGDFVAMENGGLPARIFVQNALDALLEKQPSITTFLGDLDTLGIVVDPSLADSGRLSGFAYHFGGYRFTSRSLGRGYTMGNMQKKGLDYEQDRDAGAVRAAKDRAAGFPAGRGPGNDTRDAGHAAGNGAVARSGRGTGRPGTGAFGQDGEIPASGLGRPESDPGTSDPAGHGISPDPNGIAGTRPGTEIGVHGPRPAPEGQRSRPGGRPVAERSHGTPGAEGRDAGADQEAYAAVLDRCGVGVNAGPGPGPGPGGSGADAVTVWDSRLLQARRQAGLERVAKREAILERALLRQGYRRDPWEIRERWSWRRHCREMVRTEERQPEEYGRLEQEEYAMDELVAAETAPGVRHPQRASWREWREQTFSRRYDPAYSAGMAERDIYCRWLPEDGALYLRLGKAEVIDHGPLLLAKNGDQDLPQLMETARGKGWDVLEFTGRAEFQEKAAMAALQAGLSVADTDLAQRARAAIGTQEEVRSISTPEVSRLPVIRSRAPGDDW